MKWRNNKKKRNDDKQWLNSTRNRHFQVNVWIQWFEIDFFSISIARKCDFMNNKFFVAVIEMPFLELSGFPQCTVDKMQSKKPYQTMFCLSFHVSTMKPNKLILKNIRYKKDNTCIPPSSSLSLFYSLRISNSIK